MTSEAHHDIRGVGVSDTLTKTPNAHLVMREHIIFRGNPVHRIAFVSRLGWG